VDGQVRADPLLRALVAALAAAAALLATPALHALEIDDLERHGLLPAAASADGEHLSAGRGAPAGHGAAACTLCLACGQGRAAQGCPHADRPGGSPATKERLAPTSPLGAKPRVHLLVAAPRGPPPLS
jgi:hypothetical protein